MEKRSSRSEQSAQPSAVKEPIVLLELCGTRPVAVVPAAHYLQQLWSALDKKLDLPEGKPGKGGALDSETLKVRGAAAPKEEKERCVVPPHDVLPPPPPSLLPPEMKDDKAVTNSICALSPRIVAVHGPTGTGKPTLFPLAVAHWTYVTAGVQLGLTACAQPRRLLARERTVQPCGGK